MIPFYFNKELLTKYLENSFQLGSPVVMEKVESQVVGNRNTVLLSEIVCDETIRSDIRGLAARLYVHCRKADNDQYELFKIHENPIVRLGVVLALEQINDLQELKIFYDDPDDEVRTIAREAILEME